MALPISPVRSAEAGTDSVPLPFGKAPRAGLGAHAWERLWVQYRAPLIYVAFFGLIWTLVSGALDPTVPYDAVEALNWARNAEWGTPKNPWLTGLAFWPAIGLRGPAQGVYWYASHFAGVAIGLLGVWQLALRLTHRRDLAWLAMLSLNVSGVLNIDILPYNDNYLLVMLWPWMLYLLVRAVFDTPAAWPLFGAVAGLAAMTKYSTFAIIGMACVLALVSPALRRRCRTPWFALAVAIFLLLVLPNLWWLAHHDFAAFRWVGDQIRERLNPRGVKAAACAFYPVAVLAIVALLCGARLRWPPSAEAQAPLRLLAQVLLLPLVPILAYFTVFDGGRVTEWLQPFVVPAPALLVACLAGAGPGRDLCVRRAIAGFAGAAAVVLVVYAFFLCANVKNAGQKFSGLKTLGVVLEQRWHDRYGAPLRYVGGHPVSHWLTFYVPGNPQLLAAWSSATRPNIYTRGIDEASVRRDGALLVGTPEVRCDDADFGSVLAQWPTLKIDATEDVLFSFHRNAKQRQKHLCVAWVAPAASAPPAAPAAPAAAH
ncbi:glycosyltransferase family 39 protein [Pandoraea sp. CB10b_02]|uniref:glycosyltransferase family 39 protein n=1 Tax=Pandoraea sp. CB10b_02 TaxID=2014535 RepID=UPI00258044AF|nr:glycosyltransferase family 39 protein [Pandoraea sp. CB10b_02]